jgi:hypothetical protein
LPSATGPNRRASRAIFGEVLGSQVRDVGLLAQRFEQPLAGGVVPAPGARRQLAGIDVLLLPREELVHEVAERHPIGVRRARLASEEVVLLGQPLLFGAGRVGAEVQQLAANLLGSLPRLVIEKREVRARLLRLASFGRRHEVSGCRNGCSRDSAHNPIRLEGLET